MSRVVLDTNSLIQSLPVRSVYNRAWKSFLDGTNILCVTNEILAEYEEIIERLAGEDVAKLTLDLIVSNPYTQFFGAHDQFNLITWDPDDNKFVDCAIVANAKFIVTEDHHFDILKQYDFPKVDVIRLDDFLQSLL